MAAIAMDAGALIERVRAEGFSSAHKPDGSLVTRADTEASDLICGRLSELFPRDTILSEEALESGMRLQARTWMVDPLDGTSGFARGGHNYAVHIGLVEDEAPRLGVVYLPAAEELFVAEQGRGAWHLGASAQSPVRCRMRALEPTSGPLPQLVTSSRMTREDRASLASQLPAEDLGRVASVGVKVGLLVTGAAHIYVSDHPVSYWDSCAPLVILEEAGGAASVAGGRPFQYPNASESFVHPGPFVASVAAGHDRLRQRVESILGW